ncbi:myosin-2 essential light chain-like [Acanthaster planci]|uniref:Myosin-2 essential light chain-like n=1 Tax=Acanthaster planci TaxID=133434 RepID=A0A8B7XPV8_ACAPL|nr:myosin-2 essential light chain-like [Acanthaster planci]
MSLSEEQLTEYQDAFALFDKRGDGKIEIGQLGAVIRAMGQNPTQADIKRFSQGYSKDHRITFEEFLPILASTQKIKEQGTSEDFVEGLKVFDKDGNGTISAAELRHVLTSLGEKMTDEEVTVILQGLEDSQGHVNYEEFVKTVMNG